MPPPPADAATTAAPVTAASPTIARTCLHCGTPFTVPKGVGTRAGRYPVVCSPACRTKRLFLQQRWRQGVALEAERRSPSQQARARARDATRAPSSAGAISRGEAKVARDNQAASPYVATPDSSTPTRRGTRYPGDLVKGNCDLLVYDDDETEFLKAVERYKRERRRPFPTLSELLGVLKGLGWRKVGPGVTGEEGEV
jgi:hypothetical protein